MDTDRITRVQATVARVAAVSSVIQRIGRATGTVIRVTPYGDRLFVAISGSGALEVAISRVRSVIASMQDIDSVDVIASALRADTVSVTALTGVTASSVRQRSVPVASTVIGAVSITGTITTANNAILDISNVSSLTVTPSVLRSVDAVISAMSTTTWLDSAIRSLLINITNATAISKTVSRVRNIQLAIAGGASMDVVISSTMAALANITGSATTVWTPSAVKSLAMSIIGSAGTTWTPGAIRSVLASCVGTAATSLTSSRVRALATAFSATAATSWTATVTTSSLLGRANLNYWLADSISGTTITQEGAGGAGNGTLQNGAKYLDWNSTDGDFIYLNDNASNYVWSDDSVANSPTVDYTIVAKLRSEDWSLGDEQSILTKYSSAGNRSFLWRVGTTGVFNIMNYHDGTNQVNENSPNPAWTDDTVNWVKVEWDKDNGASQSAQEYFEGGSGATPSWTSFGTDVAAVHGPYDGTAELVIGKRGVAYNLDEFKGRIYYVALYKQLGDSGDPDWECDFSQSGQTGYTDGLSGDLIEFARSTTGFKCPLVTRPEVDLETDDYISVSDHASLDVGSSTDFLAGVHFRYHGTPGGNQVLLAKKADLTTGAGYAIYLNSSRQPVGIVADGTNSVTITGTAITDHKATLVVLQRNGSNIELIQTDSSGSTSATPVSDTTSDLSNAEELRCGRLSNTGTNYSECSVFGFLVESGDTMTAGETESLLTELNTELGGRVGD